MVPLCMKTIKDYWGHVENLESQSEEATWSISHWSEMNNYKELKHNKYILTYELIMIVKKIHHLPLKDIGEQTYYFENW